MNYISVCAIFRNEARYLDEWIKYHHAIGVEHFYLYNHLSSDNYGEVLSKWASIVTLQDWDTTKYVSAQGSSYNHCLNTYRNFTRWLGFFDIDEFIVPRDAVHLQQILPGYEEAPGLGIHWKLFGSNGEVYYRPDSVIERFTKCQNDVNRHIKCFVDPGRTIEYVTPHKFKHNGAFCVDEKLRLIRTNDSIPEGGSTDIIQVNHYATKSSEECIERRSRPRADTGKTHGADFFKLHDRNDVEDFRARDIWRGIKG